MLDFLKKFINWYFRTPFTQLRNKFCDPKGIVHVVKDRRLTYLSSSRLYSIIKHVRKVRRDNVPGVFVEAGCALGGSLLTVISYSEDVPVYVFDTFEMIPPPSPHDPPEVHERYAVITSGRSSGIDGDLYYGYRSDLLSFIKGQIIDVLGKEKLKSVIFFKGLLEENMRFSDNVAFAHIDVDWYLPVRFSLDYIWPRMSSGGVVILDDYFDWGGCRQAVDEFFMGRDDFEFMTDASHLAVVKLK